MWDDVPFLRNLLELEFNGLWPGNIWWGSMSFHQSVPRLVFPTPLSPSEMMQVDVLSVAYEEGSAPGVSA
jgi:hypothetical protein